MEPVEWMTYPVWVGLAGFVIFVVAAILMRKWWPLGVAALSLLSPAIVYAYLWAALYGTLGILLLTVVLVAVGVGVHKAGSSGPYV